MRIKLRSGAFDSRWLSLSSVNPRSERFRRHMSYDSAPASAWMNDDLPDPGGPCSRYPLRYGMPSNTNLQLLRVEEGDGVDAPRSAYHSRRARKARTSSTMRSATPRASTTLCNGRRRRGSPNGRQSAPHAVCTTSRPSCPRIAASRASASSGANNVRSRESVVSVTVSHGVPDVICIARVSRSRFTCAPSW